MTKLRTLGQLRHRSVATVIINQELQRVLNPKISIPWYIINSDPKDLEGLGKYTGIMKAFEVSPVVLKDL